MQLQSPFAALTPTVDGDVLQVLARADRRFTISDLARLIPDRSYNGLRKVADRLASQGIVDVERVGVTFSYALNREHIVADAVLAVANVRERFVERLRVGSERLVLSYAAMFGSAARGVMRNDSDIDLLFVLAAPGPGGSFQPTTEGIRALVDQARRWTGNDVRAVTYTEDSIASDDPLLQSVRREGITFAGDGTFLSRVLAGAHA